MSFEIADITSYEAASGSYDVIYSRDTILHIHDKPALFRRSVLDLVVKLSRRLPAHMLGLS